MDKVHASGCQNRNGGGRARRTSSWQVAVVALLVAVLPAFAEHTRWWRQSSFDEFNKGVAKGVALRSDGKLFLAPRFAEFADANLAYLLALRRDAKGNLYAAGGSNAKVLRIDAAGKSTPFFESSELAAQSLAIDPSGNVFVGTSPDGKVYKVTPAGKSSVFFEPKTKYIWDMAVDGNGTLYVATGDGGKIFAVAPDGKAELFYTSSETHIRSIALDAKGDVLAGTEPSGLVLRIPKIAAKSPAAMGKAGSAPSSTGTAAAANSRSAFVLYETSKKEITALLYDAAGNLYVASVGEKTAGQPGQPRPSGSESNVTGTFTVTVGPGANPGVPITPGQIAPFTPSPSGNSSSVYRIAPDGAPEELWSSRDEVVYALGLLPGGKLLLGGGNEGGVIELDGNHIFSRLAKATSKQVTAIAGGPDGKLFLAAANPGKIFALGPGSEAEGSFESQAFDARMFSRWGQLEWLGSGAAASKGDRTPHLEFYARSGNTSNPENDWSPWAGPYSNANGAKIDCPAARFIQWRVVLRSAADAAVPEVDWVSVAYLPKNLPPDVTGVAVQNSGVRVQGLSLLGTGLNQTASPVLRMPQPATAASSLNPIFNASSIAVPANVTRFDPAPQGFAQKGFDSVLWTAEDANEDPLEFSVYFRGENETGWKLLKDKIDARFYSWDATTMPDGAYYLKVVASDSPANPAGEALQAERESDRFIVDNTPPEISQLTAQPEGPGTSGTATVRVKFQALDSATAIARAQYSLDAGDWLTVFPVGGLSDSLRESYDFELPKIVAGEHTVTVRAYDQFENVSSAKVTFNLPGAKR